MSSDFEGHVGFYSGGKWSTPPNTSAGGSAQHVWEDPTVQKDALRWPGQVLPSEWAFPKYKLHALCKFGNTSWRTRSQH